MLTGLRTRRHTLCAVTLALVAGCASPAGPTTGPSVVPAAVTAPSSSEPSADPTAAGASPSMSIAPTASLPPQPSATSKPSPTLNWDAVGFQASVKDPVSIGSKAKVVLKGPVGPTCKLKIKYASGVNATVPSPTHPKPGWWQWTWTIPSKAKAGTASGTSTCTYAGVPHTGDVSFKIVDPALPGGWAIDATLPSTRSSTDASPVHVVIHVRGTVPENPASDNRMICEVNIVGQGSDVVSDIPYHNGDGQFAIDAEIAALGSDAIGTQTWTVACRNEMVAHSTLKSDTGHITIT